MSRSMERVPASLLVMIEPRETKGRMPAYSPYFASIASISAWMWAGSLGSVTIRRRWASTRRFR